MKRKIISVFLVLFFLAGCTIFSENLKVKSFSEMTFKEKATLFNKLYVAQYDDYLKMVEWPTTEAQKKILREKKKILETVHPLLLEYSTLAAQGLEPTPALESTILDLLNKLGSKVG